MGTWDPVSYWMWFSQQSLYLNHLFTESILLWWQTHETVNEREEPGRKRLPREVKSWILLFEKYTFKKHIFWKYWIALMVFQQFILCSAHLGPCEKWVIDHIDEANQELLSKKSQKKEGYKHGFYWRTNLWLHD